MFISLLLMILLLLLAGALLIWQVSILFRVEFTDAKVHVRRGNVPSHFLHEAKGIARRHGLGRGRVTAVRTREGPTLRFSRDVPREVRTALRKALRRHAT